MEQGLLSKLQNVSAASEAMYLEAGSLWYGVDRDVTVKEGMNKTLEFLPAELKIREEEMSERRA
eukprot:293835-Pleurochrysis_carterae.AAC.3